MQRMSELEQDVVRHIDDVVDGAHAGCLQAARHPRWRRADRDVGDRGRVTGAEIGRLDDHAQRQRLRFSRECRLRQRQRPIGERRDFARHARHAQRIGPVGGDLEIDDRVLVGVPDARRRLDRRQLEAGHVQAPRQVADRQAGVDEVAQPRHENLHEGNCSRKRRSFS